MEASEDGAPSSARPSTPSPATRLAGVVLGLGLAVLVGWIVISRMEGNPAVRLVRSGEDPIGLYRERAEFAGARDPSKAAPGHRHLPRFPIPEKVARKLFPIDDRIQPFDELTYLRHPYSCEQWNAYPEHEGGGWTLRTNSLGMRENAEPLGTKPDVRILVTGDSHTDGVCENRESFPHVLQAALEAGHPGKTIEVLNAGKGTFSFYNYLGTLEKFLTLEPDAFVVAVYGPNDFAEVLPVYHYFQGTPRKPGAAKYGDLVQKALEIDPAWLAQDGLSLKFFQQNPEEIPVALEAAKAAVLDIQELCAAHAIRPAFVYLPGMFDTIRRARHPEPAQMDLARRLYGAMELSPSDLGVHDRMADELLAFLADRGIPALDARQVFAGREERLFWLQDQHIDVTAHRAIGEALAPFVEALALEGLR